MGLACVLQLASGDTGVPFEVGTKDDVMVVPFYGHEYYRPFPIMRDIHARFTKLARARDWRFFASYAYIAARK